MTARRAPASTLIRRRLLADVAQLRTHDAERIVGDDPEELHDARVATRRLRSDLRAFHALLDSTWAESLRDEIGWLGAQLGTARDLDVLYQRLERNLQALPERDHRAGRAVLGQLGIERTRTRSKLRSAIRSRRYETLLERLEQAAAQPAFNEDAERALGDVLRVLVKRQWRHLRAEVDALGAEPPDHALHQVRIRAKRCRYVAEAAIPTFGNRARRFARAMETLQTVLGEHQDAVVMREWLRTFSETAPPSDAFVAGELAAHEELAQQLARAKFRSVWRTARDPELRRWLRP